MARTRSIKPGFFDNELLGCLPPLTRLLFIGLWCQADREGRLEDRPRKLKKTILGYDDVSTDDVDAMLEALDRNGFIIRYKAEDMDYIQVINFVKHQNPHMKEKASEIPPPPGYEGAEGAESTEAQSGSLNNEGLGAVMTLFMDRINPTPSHLTIDKLKSYVETLSSDVCLRAINRAIEGGLEKQNWNYIQGILRNLSKQKVRSIEDWDRLEAERERQKNGGTGTGPSQKYGQPSRHPEPKAGIEGFKPADA